MKNRNQSKMNMGGQHTFTVF